MAGLSRDFYVGPFNRNYIYATAKTPRHFGCLVRFSVCRRVFRHLHGWRSRQCGHVQLGHPEPAGCLCSRPAGGRELRPAQYPADPVEFTPDFGCILIAAFFFRHFTLVQKSPATAAAATATILKLPWPVTSSSRCIGTAAGFLI